METFKSHLDEKQKDKEFKKIFEEEKQLLEISLKVIEAKKNAGLSQNELAHKANITQQQLSKIENGVNCNMLTFLKVCHALGIKIDLEKEKHRAVS